MSDPTPQSARPATPASTAQPPAPRRSFSSWLLKWLFILVAIVALAIALFLFVALRFSYSTGERAGYVQKFSRKGWVCKTWEGEVAMMTLPGTMPELFRFSVRDDEVARQITETMGERVVMTYEQHIGLPSCFGETGYFVTSVRVRPGDPTLPASGGTAAPAPGIPGAPAAAPGAVPVPAPGGGQMAPAPAPVPTPKVPQPPPLQ
jgi:hypothetical protein